MSRQLSEIPQHVTIDKSGEHETQIATDYQCDIRVVTKTMKDLDLKSALTHD